MLKYSCHIFIAFYLLLVWNFFSLNIAFFFFRQVWFYYTNLNGVDFFVSQFYLKNITKLIYLQYNSSTTNECFINKEDITCVELKYLVNKMVKNVIFLYFCFK